MRTCSEADRQTSLDNCGGSRSSWHLSWLRLTHIASLRRISSGRETRPGIHRYSSHGGTPV